MQFGERGGEFAAAGFHRQLVATNLADLNRRNTHELGPLNDFYRVERFASNNNTALRLTEKQGVQTVGRGS